MRTEKEVGPGVEPGATNTDRYHTADTSKYSGNSSQGKVPTPATTMAGWC
jgi:hypothetical protein